MSDNTISLKENSNILIRNAEVGEIIIDPNNLEDSGEKLEQLNNAHMAVIKKLVDEHATRINSDFKNLLNKVIVQKNIVHGSISNVHSMKMGDEVHYHYHIEKQTLPKELTAKIPRISPEKIIAGVAGRPLGY